MWASASSRRRSWCGRRRRLGVVLRPGRRRLGVVLGPGRRRLGVVLGPGSRRHGSRVLEGVAEMDEEEEELKLSLVI